METLTPPPEVTLIEKTRTDRGISIRSAAKTAGISEGRWRQIAKGYTTVSAGIKVPTNTTVETLTSMALAIGVTPTQMRNAGRQDVADEMTLRLSGETVVPLSEVPEPELIDEISRLVEELGRRAQERNARPAPPAEFGGLRLAARTADPGDASIFGGDDD